MVTFASWSFTINPQAELWVVDALLPQLAVPPQYFPCLLVGPILTTAAETLLIELWPCIIFQTLDHRMDFNRSHALQPLFPHLVLRSQAPEGLHEHSWQVSGLCGDDRVLGINLGSACTASFVLLSGGEIGLEPMALATSFLSQKLGLGGEGTNLPQGGSWLTLKNADIPSPS